MSRAVRHVAAVAALAAACSCSPKPEPPPRFGVDASARDVVVTLADGSTHVVARVCKEVTSFDLAGALLEDEPSPNGNWVMLDVLSTTHEGRRTRHNVTRWYVSSRGDILTSHEFPRVFGLPAANPLEGPRWVYGYPQRLRYRLVDARGRYNVALPLAPRVTHDIPPRLRARPESSCIGYVQRDRE